MKKLKSRLNFKDYKPLRTSFPRRRNLCHILSLMLFFSICTTALATPVNIFFNVKDYGAKGDGKTLMAIASIKLLMQP